MLTDSKLNFTSLTTPLSLVATAGTDVPTDPIDLMGGGVGTAVTNIIGNATLPGQADAQGMGNMRPELVVAITTALVADTGSPTVQTELGLVRADASLPFTCVMLGFGIGGMLVGRLVDRFGILLPIMATASQTPSGWYGLTLGPPTLWTSKPLAARA